MFFLVPYPIFSDIFLIFGQNASGGHRAQVKNDNFHLFRRTDTQSRFFFHNQKLKGLPAWQYLIKKFTSPPTATSHGHWEQAVCPYSAVPTRYGAKTQYQGVLFQFFPLQLLPLAQRSHHPVFMGIFEIRRPRTLSRQCFCCHGSNM